MNWGWKIVIVYGLFAVATLSIAIYFMGQKVDLVADDYYKQEMEYQAQIDKMSNANALPQPLDIFYSASEKEVQLNFPLDQLKGLQGTVHFYRPSDAGEDVSFDLKPSASGKQTISVGSLSHGYWKVKVSWRVGKAQYFHEKRLNI